MKTISLALCLSVPSAHALPIPGSGCAPTAEAAVARMLNGATSTGDPEGFRVDAVHHDYLRGRSWAVVVSCTRPALPHVAVLLPASTMASSVKAPSPMLVHAGDQVAVISRSGDSQMQLLGWAEESGRAGQQIRVRLGISLDAEHPALSLRGSVVKEGVVEVVR